MLYMETRSGAASGQAKDLYGEMRAEALSLKKTWPFFRFNDFGDGEWLVERRKKGENSVRNWCPTHNG